jgi:hypothetical protein
VRCPRGANCDCGAEDSEGVVGLEGAVDGCVEGEVEGWGFDIHLQVLEVGGYGLVDEFVDWGRGVGGGRCKGGDYFGGRRTCLLLLECVRACGCGDLLEFRRARRSCMALRILNGSLNHCTPCSPIGVNIPWCFSDH